MDMVTVVFGNKQTRVGGAHACFRIGGVLRTVLCVAVFDWRRKKRKRKVPILPLEARGTAPRPMLSWRRRRHHNQYQSYQQPWPQVPVFSWRRSVRSFYRGRNGSGDAGGGLGVGVGPGVGVGGNGIGGGGGGWGDGGGGGDGDGGDGGGGGGNVTDAARTEAAAAAAAVAKADAEHERDIRQLSDGIRRAFECPVCMDMCGTVSTCCDNGHCTCNDCTYTMIRMLGPGSTAAPKCPVCRSPVSRPAWTPTAAQPPFAHPTVRLVLRLMAATKVACVYRANGCPDLLLIKQAADHEARCPHASQVRCMVAFCNWSGTYGNLFKHVSSEHHFSAYDVTVTTAAAAATTFSPYPGKNARPRHSTSDHNLRRFASPVLGPEEGRVRKP